MGSAPAVRDGDRSGGPPETLVVLNPASGRGSHVASVRGRVADMGYALAETGPDADAVTLAREAALDGVGTIVAAGGDGTVNEVVRGIHEARAFEGVTLGVLPVGTGNNFAKQLGISDLGTAFRVLQSGARRRIDIGRADGHPFVNSAIAGLTAESSSRTSAALKRRLGVLAYVLTTLRTVPDHEPIRLTVTPDGAEAETSGWTGDALGVLVGNARRFAPGRSPQANVEDGLFDVAIIDALPAHRLLGRALVERLLGRESTYVTRFQTPSLTIRVHDPETVRFSLDGEILQRQALSLSTRPRTLNVAVGETYRPAPV